MKHIWIDCDPGHDDAMAILTAYANPEKLHILGVSTIGGNQTLQKVTQNAKNVLSFIGADIPLAMGQPRPLVKPLNTAWIRWASAQCRTPRRSATLEWTPSATSVRRPGRWTFRT